MALPPGGGEEGAAGRSRRATPNTALIVGSVTVLLLVAVVPLSVAAHQSGGGLSLYAIMVPFAVVGLIIARRQPHNPIGWIMVAIAAIYTLGTDAGIYAFLAFRMGHPGLPLARLAVALTQCWIVLPTLLPLPILLFPDGRLPSGRRWRGTVWVYLAVCVSLFIGTAARDVAAFTEVHIQVDDSGELLTFSQSPGGLSAVVGAVCFLVLVIISLSWVIRQIVAYRRSTGERRQQLKWLVSGGAIAIIGFTLALVFGNASNPILRLLGIGFLGVIAVPVSIGVGVLKYRLYEIDRLISRTASYAIVTGVLLGTYATIVALASSVVPRSSSAAVAAATLAAAMIARPLLRRVQDIVDRRFNRARYDALRTVEAFRSRLQNQVDVQRVREDLEGIVNDTLQPQTVMVWIPQPE